MATTEQRESTRAARPRRAPLTFNQFMLAQVPLLVIVALVFGGIAYATRGYLPVGGVSTGSDAGSGASQPVAAGGGMITAFSPETAAQTVQVAADTSGALKWDRATYEAQAGDISFVVVNKSSSPHNFAIEGSGINVQSKNFGANTTNTYTVKGLPPGEYLIVCNYPGHRAAGMVAKLIVR